MSEETPWCELGIGPSRDAAAIRSAYARKLKAMGRDLDPTAYARLRRARDAALRGATAGLTEGVIASSRESRVPASAAREAEDARDGTRESSACPPRTSGSDAGDALAIAPHLTRLRSLLRSGNDAHSPSLSNDDEAAARACVGAVVAEALRSDLARQHALEHELVRAFTDSWPRCAPLLEEVAEAFGWARSAGTLGESPAIASLNAGLAGYRFRRDVGRPTHRLHRAWVELANDRSAAIRPRLGRRASERETRELIDTIRRRFPELQTSLDPGRVVAWEKRSAAPRKPFYYYTAWLACLLSLAMLLLTVFSRHRVH